MKKKKWSDYPYAQGHKALAFRVTNSEYYQLRKIGFKYGGMSGFIRHCVLKELSQNIKIND